MDMNCKAETRVGLIKTQPKVFQSFSLRKHLGKALVSCHCFVDIIGICGGKKNEQMTQRLVHLPLHLLLWHLTNFSEEISLLWVSWRLLNHCEGPVPFVNIHCTLCYVILLFTTSPLPMHVKILVLQIKKQTQGCEVSCSWWISGSGIRILDPILAPDHREPLNIRLRSLDFF